MSEASLDSSSFSSKTPGVIKNLVAITLLASIQVPALANRALTEAERLADFNQLVYRIESNYGPLKLKPTSIGLDMEHLKARYRDEVVKARTNGEFYYTIVRFVAEFKDGHFGAQVPTTRRAALPFSTDLVEGKVLIDQIERTMLPELIFPYERGDEVIEMGGRSAPQLLDFLSRHVSSGYELSARRTAAMMFTVRSGAIVPVPEGKVLIKIRRVSGEIGEVSLPWIHTGDAIDEDVLPDFGDAPKIFSTKFPLVPKVIADLGNLSIRDDLVAILGPERLERSYRCSGLTRIEPPEGAKPIQLTPFVAYTYPTAKGEVGYLRLPHYMPQGPSGEPLFEEYLSRYTHVVRQLEARTVGLVIDQDHNCGGSVDYLESIAGLFVEQPHSGLEFQFLANKESFLSFNQALGQTPAGTLEHGLVKNLVDLTRTAWNRGDFLTEKSTFHPGEKLYPSPYRYTKPVIVLIDELSGSGGDAFPAMMQGLGRAKLVGTRTSGLGGHVNAQAPLNYSGIAYRMTRSLFFHPNGTPIENNGATPDFPYAITRDDFVNGYRAYREFYTQKLLEQIP